MANFNKVLLMGNLTRDPELKYLPSGTAIVSAGLAVNRKYRNRNTQEMVEETTFVDLEGWGPQAETFSRYLTKGRPVFVEGRLKLDTWQGKDGQKRNKLLVVIENFQFLGAPAAGGREARPPATAPARAGRSAPAGQVSEGDAGPAAEDYDFDDIPF